MNPFSSDLKTILHDKGIGSTDNTADWSIHLAGLPSQPNEVYGLVDIPGEAPIYLTDGTTIERPAVQLMARAYDYEVPHAKLSGARDAVELIENYTQDNALYWIIKQDMAIQFLSKDENGRFIWIVHLSAWRTKS